ncbi:MAG: hypothetical protein KBC47_01550 [Candidatus Peribacteraceae bacterium]|nr:hypothetical protein [Candidatus Peribacteraceae bacterium]
MQNRREFLTSAVALGATLVAPRVLGQTRMTPALGINERLTKIAELLRRMPEIARVDDHLVDSPTNALVQWRWAHFRSDIDPTLYPDVERVNQELLTAMLSVYETEGNGLDELMVEGLVDGIIDTQIERSRRVQRQLITHLFTTHNLFGVQDRPPQPATVRRELNVEENLRRPVNQVIYPNNAPTQLLMSPLGRLGAGYILSTQKPVMLLPAEDPAIDAKAEWAEKYGTEAEYQKWVKDERDKHFVKLVRSSTRDIVHFIVGYGHELTDDIAAGGNDMSHLVITPKGVDVIKQKAVRP